MTINIDKLALLFTEEATLYTRFPSEKKNRPRYLTHPSVYTQTLYKANPPSRSPQGHHPASRGKDLIAMKCPKRPRNERTKCVIMGQIRRKEEQLWYVSAMQYLMESCSTGRRRTSKRKRKTPRSDGDTVPISPISSAAPHTYGQNAPVEIVRCLQTKTAPARRSLSFINSRPNVGSWCLADAPSSGSHQASGPVRRASCPVASTASVPFHTLPTSYQRDHGTQFEASLVRTSYTIVLRERIQP